MMHPTQCASCHAPLPPGAFQCAYCKTATPLGMQQAHQQQHFAATAAAHRQRINLTTVADNAKWSLIVSLIGLPICCAPLSLVGAFLGFRALRLAKAEQVAVPTRAYASIGIGAATTVLFAVALTAFILDAQATADRLAAVQKRLEGKREAEPLDPKVACDLAEERLLEAGHGENAAINLGDVKCEGALEVKGKRATLGHVYAAFGAKRLDLTACLVRGQRWFVLKMIEGEACGDAAAAAPPAAGGKLTEEQLRAQEKKAREDADKAEAAASVKAYTDGLLKLRASTPKLAGLSEAECPKATIQKHLRGEDHLKLPTVDFDYLDRRTGAAGAKQWSWLTSDRIRKVVEGNDGDKAKAVRDLREQAGPLVVVYRAEEKIWPKVTADKGILKDDFSYDRGEYLGALLIFNVDTGDRLCQAKLRFESGDGITYKRRGMSSEKNRAEDAVEDDFKEQFETAATASIKRVAPGLRLGYKVLE